MRTIETSTYLMPSLCKGVDEGREETEVALSRQRGNEQNFTPFRFQKEGKNKK